MTVAVGDILKVVASLVYLADGGINQNVFNALIVGAGGPYADGDIVEDAVAWIANMYANLSGQLTEDIDGAQCQVYKWDTVNDDWDEVGTDPWTFTPTETDGYLPRGVAALVLARTVDPDVLGKKYIPGMTETAIANGLFVAPTVTTMLAFGADWITEFAGASSGADWDPGIWSPTQEQLFDMGGAIIANLIPAYQRRRKRGVGI